MESIKYLDLFSGIGGFALGAYWAGLFEHVDQHFFSEVDPYAIGVYKSWFPGAVAIGDIARSDPGALPAGEWWISGGFPCQDISQANYKARGLDGERSGLWFAMLEHIRVLRPRIVLIENVPAIRRRGIGSTVLAGLAAIGYDAEWFDLRASDVGSPQRRERFWCVAWPVGDPCFQQCEWGGQEGKPEERERLAYAIEELADADNQRRGCNRAGGNGRNGIRKWADVSQEIEDGFCKMGDPSCTGLEGLPSTEFGPHQQNPWAGAEIMAGADGIARAVPGSDYWPGPLVDGISRTVAIKAIGGSLVPQIAALFWRRIMDIHGLVR